MTKAHMNTWEEQHLVTWANQWTDPDRRDAIVLAIKDAYAAGDAEECAEMLNRGWLWCARTYAGEG